MLKNVLWKSQQASLRDHKNQFVFWEISTCLLLLACLFMSSLPDTQNLGLIVIFSLAFTLGSSFLATYGTCLGPVLFSVSAPFLLMEWSRLLSLCLGCFDLELPFFLSTTSLASIWAVTCLHTSDNISARFQISESLNGLSIMPCTKAATTISFFLGSKSY